MTRRLAVILCLIPPLFLLRSLAVSWAAQPPAIALATQSAAAGRTIALPIRSNLLGADWEGAGSVEVRAKGSDGRWSNWVPLEGAPAEGPDPNGQEAHAAAARVPASARTNASVPLWVGDATHAQIRTHGAAHAVHLVSINALGTATPAGQFASALRHTAAKVLGTPTTAPATTTEPDIVTRAEWGADESIRRAQPVYSPTLQAAVIHHTVTSNTYSASDAASIVNGIYVYHVKHNGWNDIGYNLLVDKYGQVFEGRKGGVTRNVLGAHSGGFNTNTTGIALLGTYSSAQTTTAQRAALVHLLSWRLDIAHVDPRGSSTLTSAGNDKYSAGSRVVKRNVSGHRDLYSTSCPGNALYADIDRLRAEAWQDGGPKIAGPAVTVAKRSDGTVSSITVQAHGNRALVWSLTATNAATDTVLGTATATTATATKLTAGIPSTVRLLPWQVRIMLTGTDGATSARPLDQLAGVAPPTPKLGLALTPMGQPLVSPNGDGLGERLAATVKTNTHQSVTMTVLNLDGTLAATLWSDRSVTGSAAIQLATSKTILALPDGRYRLHVESIDDSQRSPADVNTAFALNRTLYLPKLPVAFSPNRDHRLDAVAIRAKSTAHTARLTYGKTTATLPPSSSVRKRLWKGAGIKDGRYTISLTDLTEHLRLSRVVVRDTRLPRVSARRTKRGIRVSVSEHVTLTGWVLVGRRHVKRRLVVAKASTFVTRRFPRASQLTAMDRAGNTTRTRVR
jgi:hypothetical protein